jgi:hypothetical protein
MDPKRWHAFLPALLLGVSTLLVARPADRDAAEDKPPALGATADLSTAPRVGVDRPKPTYMLHERDKRVHGLRPFQELVDAAPAGSTLRPPPGSYSGPVGHHRCRRSRHGVLARNRRRRAARPAPDRIGRFA